LKTDSVRKVSQEAANLLYHGIEKEYKQAKLKAAKTYGAKFLPTNLQIAMDLDRMAEENEGLARSLRLVKMRKEALELMEALKKYRPLLTGSVWRGTIKFDSDIDINVYNDKPQEILSFLRQNNYEIIQTESTTITKSGRKMASFHIYLMSPTEEKIETTIRSSDEAGRKEKCEIYGDTITGLSIEDLEKLLNENPTKRFLPF
jgi:predicted nucleotidyltransferase